MWGAWAVDLADRPGADSRTGHQGTALRIAGLRPRRRAGHRRRASCGDADGPDPRRRRRPAGTGRARSRRPRRGAWPTRGMRPTRSPSHVRSRTWPPCSGRCGRAAARIAVATSDDRDPTVRTLDALGLSRPRRRDRLRRRRPGRQARAGRGPDAHLRERRHRAGADRDGRRFRRRPGDGPRAAGVGRCMASSPASARPPTWRRSPTSPGIDRRAPGGRAGGGRRPRGGTRMTDDRSRLRGPRRSSTPSGRRRWSASTTSGSSSSSSTRPAR